MANISIKILKDNTPELDEVFQVEITKAELIGSPVVAVQVGSPKRINVTITANDQPYGLFSINIANTGTIGRNYTINEPTTGSTSIDFEVKRTQGIVYTLYEALLCSLTL